MKAHRRSRAVKYELETNGIFLRDSASWQREESNGAGVAATEGLNGTKSEGKGAE